MWRCSLIALSLALSACTSGAVVSKGAGASIGSAQAKPAAGDQYRVAVGRIIDKTDPASEKSLTHQLGLINASRVIEEQLHPTAITQGIQDMLVTELFNVDRFIVLERAGLNEIISEQEFSQSARAGDATRIPRGELEGAELIVLGALTAFDAGVEGGALPIPVPLDSHGSFGLLHLRLARGHVAMDLRVIDARSGRVLSAVAVEGRNTRFGMNFDAYLRGNDTHVDLPSVLTYFQNTPVEEALQKMVTVAVAHITERVSY